MNSSSCINKGVIRVRKPVVDDDADQNQITHELMMDAPKKCVIK